jgi:hypothetical protein
LPTQAFGDPIALAISSAVSVGRLVCGTLGRGALEPVWMRGRLESIGTSFGVVCCSSSLGIFVSFQNWCFDSFEREPACAESAESKAVCRESFSNPAKAHPNANLGMIGTAGRIVGVNAIGNRAGRNNFVFSAGKQFERGTSNGSGWNPRDDLCGGGHGSGRPARIFFDKIVEHLCRDDAAPADFD